MLPERKRYTYADICDTGEDERYELIDGEVYLLGAPKSRHAIISSELYGFLRDFLKGKTCRAIHSPIDVFLFNEPDDPLQKIDYVVEPDVVVYCDPKQVGEYGIYGPPKLVIEVLSKSTLRHDRITKFNLYRQAGVAEYWIVDPRNFIVTVYYLQDGVYITHENYTKDQVLHSAVFPDLSIELAEIFVEW